MNAKDEAAPHTRLSMEARWRNARQSCDDGVCDDTQQRWHRAGCERRKAKAAETADSAYVEVVRLEPGQVRVTKLDETGEPVGESVEGVITSFQVDLAPLYEEGTPADEKAGWCAPSEVLYAGYDIPLEIPAITVERGGIFFPSVTLHHDIRPVKDHWWSRTWYEVWTRPYGSASPEIYMGQFRTREDANQQCADLDKLNYEIERRKRQIDNAR